jgi:hypothetical protein
MSLTPNAVSGMFRMGGTADNPSFSPTVQVVHLKKIDNKSGADERWKVGSYFVMHCCALIGGVSRVAKSPIRRMDCSTISFGDAC